jgi:hypothetical protein
MDSTSNSYGTQPVSKLDWALYYVRHSIRVMPLHHVQKNDTCSCEKDCGSSAGKHPRLTNWKELASTDERMIRTWWMAFPRANIGIVCGGASDLTVIDLDSPDAHATIARLEKELGPLPPMPRVTSGKGPGHDHLYFRHVPGLRNKVKLEFLDFRNEGGYIVAPGSISGFGPYLWQNGCTLDDTPVTEMPVAWREYFLARQDANGAGSVEGGDDDSVSEIEAMLSFIDPEPYEKWRNVGMALDAHLGQGGRSLWDAWSKRCKKKFNQAGQDRAWASFKAGGGITFGTLRKLARDGGWRPKSASQEESSRNETLEGYGLLPIEAAELLALEIPPRHCMLTPWLRERDLAMVYSWRGTAKRFLPSASPTRLRRVAASLAGKQVSRAL